jgi:hypothetical protein
MTKAQLIHLLEKVPDDTVIQIAEDSRTHTYPIGEDIKMIKIERTEVDTYQPPRPSTTLSKITVFLIPDN